MKRKSSMVTLFSLAIFFIGLFAFLGSYSYSDFYLEIKSKINGDFIDYSALSEFCGWTGLPLPGESQWDRGLRAFWNMLSALMGMTAFSMTVFLCFVGVILGIVRLTGGFNERDSS